MEENNENNEKSQLKSQMMNSAKNTAGKASEAVGNGAKSLLSLIPGVGKIIKFIPAKAITGILVAVLLVIILIASFWWGITEKIFKDVAGAIGGFISNLVSVSDDGTGAQLQFDAAAMEKIRDILEDAGLKMEDLRLAGDINYATDMTDPANIALQNYYLQKFFEAEAVSTYPKVGDTGLQGTIHIKRDNGMGPRDMKYISYSMLERMVSNEVDTYDLILRTLRNNMLDYFSLDGDYLCVIKVTTITEKFTRNGAEGYAPQVTTKYEIEKINYRSLIHQYSMPMEFMFGLCIITQNPGFAEAIAERVKNSVVHLTLQDTQYTEETTTTDAYTTKTMLIIQKYDNEGNPAGVEQVEDASLSNVDVYEKKVVSITPMVNITFADTWISTAEYRFNLLVNPKQYPNGENPTPVPYGPSSERRGDKAYETEGAKTTKIVTEEIQWAPGPVMNPISKEDEVLELFDTAFLIPNSRAKNATTGGRYEIPGGNLKSAPEALFELLGNAERTQRHEEIMRYLMYKYTGTSYGILNLNFDFNNPGSFTYVGSGSGAFWWPIGSLDSDTINTTTETYTDSNGVTKTRTMAIGEPSSKELGDPFGCRCEAAHKQNGHSGQDIRKNNITVSGYHNIIAVADGVVTTMVTGEPNSFELEGSGYGNVVYIKHDDGDVVTRYAHLHNGSITVKVGDKVKQGQVIGKMGSSGRSSGIHLHFEVLINGIAVDPMNYINPNVPRPEPISNQSGSNGAYYDTGFASQTTPPTSDMVSKSINVRTTVYDTCFACCGKIETDSAYAITRTGIKLAPGMKVIAVDPSIIPLGSWVYVPNYGYALAADIGGGVQGEHIDIYSGISGDIIGNGTEKKVPQGPCLNAPAIYGRYPAEYATIQILKPEFCPQNGKGTTSTTNTTTKTVSVGEKTYKEYKQSEYASVQYWEGTMQTDGCGPTAVAIIGSAYGKTFTPPDIAAFMGHTSYLTLERAINEKLGLGTQYKSVSSSTTAMEDIRTHLSKGKPVIVSVSQAKIGGQPNLYTNNSHILVLLGESNGKLILSNPGSRTEKNPNETLENLMRYLYDTTNGNKYYILVD